MKRFIGIGVAAVVAGGAAGATLVAQQSADEGANAVMPWAIR